MKSKFEIAFLRGRVVSISPLILNFLKNVWKYKKIVYIFVQKYIDMNFKPNGSWVVLPDPSKNTTDSGIFLDDKTAKSMNTNILEVLAAGPQCHFAKIGDSISLEDYHTLLESASKSLELKENLQLAVKELQVFLSFLCTRENIEEYVEEFNRQSKTSKININGGIAKIETKDI